MEEKYRQARELLFGLEKELDADSIWKRDGISFWWSYHFSLFNKILDHLTEGATSLADTGHPWKKKIFAALLSPLILLKGFVALHLSLLKRRPVIFVSPQHAIQKAYDPDSRSDRFLDVSVDPVKRELARTFDTVILDQSSFANIKNFFRSFLFRGLSAIPSAYFDLTGRFSPVMTRLEPLEVPEKYRPLLSPCDIEAIREDAARRAGKIEQIMNYFRRLKPLAIVAIDENLGSRDFIMAAKRLKIPTFALQHGIIHEFHPSYIYPSWSRSVPLADRTYLYGDFTKKLLVEKSIYPDAALMVAGQPRMFAATHMKKRFDRTRFKKLMGIPMNRPLVVFTSQPVVRTYPDIEMIFRTLAKEEVFLLVKLHPGERHDRFYFSMAAQSEYPPARLKIIRDVDLYSALLASDRVLSVMSTTIAEAIVLGAQVGVLNMAGMPDRYRLEKTSLARTIQNENDLKHFLASGVRPDRDELESFTHLHYDGSLNENPALKISRDIVLRLGVPV